MGKISTRITNPSSSCPFDPGVLRRSQPSPVCPAACRVWECTSRWMLEELKALGVSLKSAWAPSGPDLSSSGPGQHTGWPAGHWLSLGKGMRWAAITKACRARTGGTVWGMSRRARPSGAYGDLLSQGAGQACPGSSGPALRPPASPQLECWALCERATELSVRLAASPIGWCAGWGAGPGAGIPDGTLKLCFQPQDLSPQALISLQPPSAAAEWHPEVLRARCATTPSKKSSQGELRKYGCPEQDPLPYAFLLLGSSRASSSWPRLQFRKFRKFSEACAGLLADNVAPPAPPEQVPVRLWGFPHDGCGSLESGSGPVSRCRAGPSGGPRGAGSQGLPRGDSSRVAAARWLSVRVEP